jgi:membrane associated rhomboid family serine protease
MIPLYDLERLRRVPYVTYGLIGLNMLVFLWEMTLSAQGLGNFFRTYGAIPNEISASLSHWPSLVSSLFVHGNWLHLAGNLLVLFIFGDDIEDWLGAGLFAAFYGICGVLAGLVQVIFSPNSEIPVVGASGAIAGVLGAYYLLFPETPIRCLSLRCFYTRRLDDIAAVWVILFWLVYQVVNMLINLDNTGGGGAAFFAHLGGFLAGLALTSIYTQRVKGITRPINRTLWGSAWELWRTAQQYTPPTRPTSTGMPARPFTQPRSSADPIRPPGFERRPFGASAPKDQDDDLDQTVEDYSPELEDQRMDMREMEAELQTLREKIVKMPTKSREFLKPPQLNLEGLATMDARAKAITFFNAKRGQRIQLETHNGNYYKGEVVSISSKQVFLRDDNGRSTWIPLGDIARVY